jgi:hypothetical protein
MVINFNSIFDTFLNAVTILTGKITKCCPGVAKQGNIYLISFLYIAGYFVIIHIVCKLCEADLPGLKPDTKIMPTKEVPGQDSINELIYSLMQLITIRSP